MNILRRFFKDESGSTMVEYGLIVALIAIVAIVVITILGQQIDNVFQTVVDCVQDPSEANCTVEDAAL